MFKAYFDESYGREVMTVGGWVGKGRGWERLERTWKQLLRREGLKVVGCADLMYGHKNSQFADWPAARRDRLFDDCTSAIHCNVEAGIFASLALKDLRHVLRRRGFAPTDQHVIEVAYQICGLGCAVSALQHVNGRVRIAFERGMRGAGVLGELAYALNDEAGGKRPLRLEMPFPAKTEMVVLQAADFMAWAHHRFARTVARSGNSLCDLPTATRRIVGRLRVLGGEYDKEALSYLLTYLAPRRRKPDVMGAFSELKRRLPRFVPVTRPITPA